MKYSYTLNSGTEQFCKSSDSYGEFYDALHEDLMRVLGDAKGHTFLLEFRVILDYIRNGGSVQVQIEEDDLDLTVVFLK